MTQKTEHCRPCVCWRPNGCELGEPFTSEHWPTAGPECPEYEREPGSDDETPGDEA